MMAKSTKDKSQNLSEIVISIIQKAKDELNISDDLQSTELYDRLFEYRNSLHPDKFLDEKTKKDAEEKFKEISNILTDLSKHIQQETIQKKPSELVVFKNELALVNSKQLTIDYENKIKILEYQLETKNNEITLLKRNIKAVQGEKVDQKTQELIKHYQTSKPTFFKLGITLILTVALGVITKIDDIAKFILKYSPIKPEFINTAIFIIIILIPLIYFKSYLESRKVEYIAKQIKTPKFLSEFVRFLQDRGLSDTFTELDVYDFLLFKLRSTSPIAKLLYAKLFVVYSDATIDTLKDIFIHNLYTKQFIYISSSKMLDRTFKISHYSSAYHRDTDEDLGF